MKINRKISLGFVCGAAIIALIMGHDSSQAREKDMNAGQRELAAATFAGGCFWCVESAFEAVAGVIRVASGYTGGNSENPSYEEVCSGKSGHVEAVQVHYDPALVSYEELLAIFWKQVDPTDPGGQFADRGSQYRTAIFFHDEAQQRTAEASKAALAASGRFERPVITEIAPLVRFYQAETYHQDFHRKNPLRYQLYRRHSGRDAYLREVWEKDEASLKNRYQRPAAAELANRLTPLQYQVTRQNATEPPFQNAYHNHRQAGIYVDIVSGEPLFSSLDKFDSGSGWPSFTQSLEPDHIVEKTDHSHFMARTEVRSRHGDSHLGHVFADGPAPTGLRYCINSAALRFIAVEDLAAQGYGQYRHLFP